MMSSTSTGQSSRAHKSSSLNGSRTSAALPKTQVVIHVYDLLPPGRLSSFLWTIGSSLLHTGVVIHEREYAYGGHSRRGQTGVYWSKPGLAPPGAIFRTEILQGFTFRTATEIEAVIREVSEQFPGREYNLLRRNCNHFTSALCRRLTARAAPAWLNRAASIGLALPCVVPREWIASPPDHETAEGQLLDVRDGGDPENAESDDDDDDDDEDERSGMLDSNRRRQRRRQSRGGFQGEEEDNDDEVERNASVNTAASNTVGGGGASGIAVRDAVGRNVPPAERAPVRKS